MPFVYKLTSPENKCYVGLTKDTVKNRFKQHVMLWAKLKRRGLPYAENSGCPLLYNAFDLHSPETWVHEVLFEDDDYGMCASVEIYFIKELNSRNLEFGYNVLEGGQTGKANHKTSEKTKQAQSESRKAWYETKEGQEWKQFLSKRWKENNPSYEGQTGRPHTEETKKKISEVKKGFQFSDEHKQALRDAKASPEVRQQLSDSAKERWEAGVYKDNGRKITEAQTGRPQVESQKIKVADALSKTFLVIDPEGNEFRITNLSKWCRENNLNVGNMCSVSKGVLKQYKGYKVRRINEDGEIIVPTFNPNTKESKSLKIAARQSKTYVITDPEGNEFQVSNLRQWCKSNNLHPGSMSRVAKGTIRQYKGYKASLVDSHIEDNKNL